MRGAGGWGWKAKLALVLGAGYTVLAALGSLFLACQVALCGETTATSSPAPPSPGAQASVASLATGSSASTVEREVGARALASPPSGRLSGLQVPVAGSTATPRSTPPPAVEGGPRTTATSPAASKSGAGASASSAGPTGKTPRAASRSRQSALDVDRLHEQNVKASAEPKPAGACCKVCRAGQPCGDSCISRSKLCHKPPGCTC
ncbi:MAG TPA: hypothetical protein PKW35_19100 [Nannocystaceae bacterium]|nr:hypothetical protein [Nannocystaceae bacterium]